MKPSEAEENLCQLLAEERLPLALLRPSEAVRVMLRFYQQIRAEGYAPDGGHDSLLYQWGTYGWTGGGEFYLGFARQFYKPDDEGGCTVAQLHLSLIYEQSTQFHGIAAGSHWCHLVSEADDFARFVTSSPAYLAGESAKLQQALISYDAG